MGAFVSCIGMYICESACCMACSCFGKALNCTLAQMTRLGHIIIFFMTISVAIILGKSYPREIMTYGKYLNANLGDECISSSFSIDCIFSQLIYRSSAALTSTFILLASLSSCSEFSDKNIWPIKLILPIIIFFSFFWVDDIFFSGFAELARILSFFWLLMQSILLLDFAHDIHDYIIRKADDAETEGGITYARKWYALYLFLCLGFLAAVGVGLSNLFSDYSTYQLGLFFVIITLISGILTSIMSLLEIVSKGLLTPCIMFAYSTFICWYALTSCRYQSCNPNLDNKDASLAIAVVSSLSCLILFYCVFQGTTILNIFNPEGQGVIMSHYPVSSHGGGSRGRVSSSDQAGISLGQAGGAAHAATSTTPLMNDMNPAASSSTGTRHERVLFHVIMILASCYSAMVLTSWGNSDGSPLAVGSPLTADLSLWLKIISQWIFVLLYFRVLYVAYLDNIA